jgi:glyoxylase-like metal-dependent hydrolase (beta-lactamase superfamily II)
MRKRDVVVALSALASGLAFAANAQTPSMDDVEIRTLEAAPGVHMLVGRGGNIGVSSGEDGVFLIDDQFAPLTPKIRAAVAKLSDAPVRFLLNTHWHGDHTGGNENFAGLGAILVAHDNVRSRMSTDQFMAAFDRTVPASPAAALPVVTFGADVTLHWNGDEIHAVHVPAAHTDGDAIVHFRNANVIHAGDVYFAGRYPFIDLGSGGSFDGLIAAVDRVLGLADDATKIIPGHGELSDSAELARYRAMLVTVRDRVTQAIAAGKTLDVLLAERPLADLDAEWAPASSFVTADAFVRAAYTSLRAR